VLHRKHIPQYLRDAALGQVQLSYDMQDERDDALKHCPPFVRNQILKYLYRRRIAQNYLLHNTTTQLVDSLTSFVSLEFFFPDTPLIDPFQVRQSIAHLTHRSERNQLLWCLMLDTTPTQTLSEDSVESPETVHAPIRHQRQGIAREGRHADLWHWAQRGEPEGAALDEMRRSRSVRVAGSTSRYASQRSR
jgi:hypothetical protein